jgi:putative FmdB family regulatory protein
MPIYEWRCGACGLTFEGLAALQACRSRRRCPECGGLAARVISSFAIAAGDATGELEIDVLTRPLAPPIPPAARFCWMNDRAAERFAAHRIGRGAEYDDRQARAKELGEQRGLAASKPKTAGGKRRPARKHRG